ncbi:hypothetical protein F2Q69_00010306 [Brassica cretica]|uniref:Plastid lipid-associated protein/fibrillin conserved domain-containing protein n=1 Tax=Brassica cretica TaxID=69181 RepID=A0A8S9QT04_BRACR|nr:hypothetical protein F2Q69_00010306 [Brassica cretica]
MSGRLLKKVLKEHEESKPQNHHDEEEEEDEDEEQLGGSRNRSSINPFDLLNDGDEDPESEKEAEIYDEEEKKKDEEADTVQPPSSKNKSKNKKKKKTKESRSNVVVKPEITLDETLEALSLGANSKQEEEVQETKPASSRPVLEIDPKYLNLENELRRMYGSKVVRSLESSSQSGGGGGGSSRQGRGGRRGVHHITKTVLITPMENWARWDRSFSMEFLETKDGYNYFRYTHSSSYEQAQRAFQAAQNLHDLNGVASVLINNPYHIDSLITMADYFKFAGDHQMSADAIGKCLYGLERAWHPMFTPFNGTSRLKYSHDANKPFFTALFAHMRNMDRRGCHRSALEVCKLLLSLDTDNPVGALFCVDYFALRAEEYAWLEEFSEEYQSENSLWLFPNFSYSLAIARVYLEKTEEASLDSSKSSSLDLMMQALKLHPTVLKKLVDKVPLKDQAWGKMLKHYYFRIKPFGLNINTDHRKRFSCRVNTTAAKLDGTWRLQYTSAPDVVVLFEAASRFPFFQVGQIFQKFECRDRSDGGIIRNVVQWSVPSLLEEQEGATLVVTAKFDKVSSRNIYLQFEEISVRKININEQVQALLAPAILPRSFLNLQILQFIRTFNAQIPVTATSPGRRSVGGLYYLSYLDNNMLLGRSVGGGGVFVFTKSQPLEL